MDVSIFDIVGPIMLGPSSSGTAGMVRIGAIARRFLSGEPQNVEIQFHPRYEHYAGCRSHLGLIGGLMGFAPDDFRFPVAFDEAKRRGIHLAISRFPKKESADAMRVRLVVDTDKGARHKLVAVSIGGGNVTVQSVDEIPVSLNAYASYVYIWAVEDVKEKLSILLGADGLEMGQNGNSRLYYTICPSADETVLAAIRQIPGVTRAEWISAFFVGGRTGNEPLFTEFSQLLQMCREKGTTIPEVMLAYEVNRSGLSPASIRERMAENWRVMKQSVQNGIAGQARPLYGLDDGMNAKRMLDGVKSGKTLSGGVLGRAVAYGLAVMESAMAMGCIVAAPTCGSSGISPGCLVALQEIYGYSDRQMVDALFVSTSIGVIMAYDGVRFSGVAAGCQGEITVSAAMAAGSVAFLGGADSQGIGDAASLAVKAMLGLVCDPMGCVEVPCIKRNGAGIAVALSSADMALAGIRSYISPDDASFAVKDVQDHLPERLRGGGGGTACTPAACQAHAQLQKIDEDYLRENM